MARKFKIKTNSTSKKRFRLMPSGKIKGLKTGKRHCMIKRSSKSNRQKRGLFIMNYSAVKNVLKFHNLREV